MNLPAITFLPVQPGSVDGIKQFAAETLSLNDKSRLILLFDAANHPAGLKAVEQYARQTSAAMSNLLDHLPEGDAPDVGFYLVDIDPQRAREVLDYWADPEIQPAAVWLWSQWDTPTLAVHLRQFVLVQHRPERSGLLRIADPHIWRALTNELEDCVGQMLCSPLDAWWMSDMDGRWHSVTPVRRSRDKPASPLVFKEGQVARLVEAMWPAQIYFALYSTQDELPALGSRMARMEAVRDEYARAKEWGGYNARDYVMFSSLAGAFGTTFDKAPSIRKALQQGKDQNMKLADTLRSIPPESWERA